MKGKQISILAVVAIILIVGAIKTSQKKADPAIDMIGTTVLADLNINSVDALLIVGASAHTTVERHDAGWTVKEKYGYPADFDKVRRSVIDLSELKVADVIDLAPEEFARLDIADPSPDVDSKRVTLKSGDTVLGTLILGKEHSKQAAEPSGYGGYPDGRYVSLAGGKHVFRVSNPMTALGDTPIDWVDSDLLSIAATDLETITITGPNRTPLSLTRDGTDLTLEGMGENEEGEASKLSTLGNALSYLTLSDIADPSISDADLGLDQPTEWVATAKNGTVYTLQLGSAADAGGRYLRIGVAYPAHEAVEAAASTSTSNAVAEASSEQEATLAKQRSEAEALNSKLSAWTFVVAYHTGDAMLTTRDQLVKQKEAPEDSEASRPMTPDELSESTLETAPIEGSATEEGAAPTPAETPDDADSAHSLESN